MLTAVGELAFRMETQPRYAEPEELAEVSRFLDGLATRPPDVDWWQPWIGMVTGLTGAGKRVMRVGVLAEPPTGYQQWRMWASRWLPEASLYLPRSRAEQIGLPVGRDWWLFDDSRLVIMHYTSGGEFTGAELETDPVTVAQHVIWQRSAVRHATPAEDFIPA